MTIGKGLDANISANMSGMLDLSRDENAKQRGGARVSGGRKDDLRYDNVKWNR